MSLFQCTKCGCIENTAVSMYHTQIIEKKPVECSACAPNPSMGVDGWHNKFLRTYLPKGMFITDHEGNLVHKDTSEYPDKYETDKEQ